MSTALAVSPATTSLAPTVAHLSPRPYPAVSSLPAPHSTSTSASTSSSSSSSFSSSAAAEPAHKRAKSNASPGMTETTNNVAAAIERPASPSKSSPIYRAGPPPMIKVKKEPGSPSLQSARPRPKRLDLSSSNTPRGPQTARPSAPLTSARDSAGLAIQDVGLACLSPGFQTHDPAMREQLQRSLDVRDRQRMIIEARQKGTKPSSSHDASDGPRTQDHTLFGVHMRTPTTSRRKGPPPGLSINAPSASQFANDRVIQSAPMHQTFTGLRPGEHPYTRHTQLGPSGLGSTSHIHHVPPTQTSNRLPPISDVFAQDNLESRRPYPGNNNSPGSHAHVPPPVPSPGFPPQHQQHPSQTTNAPPGARTREFRSAEEAVQGLSGGRDDLMPKVVHYGGVQPPTPPSPVPAHRNHGQTNHGHHHSMSSQHGAAYGAPPPDSINRTTSTNGARRRGRDEYERDNASSPPPSSHHHVQYASHHGVEPEAKRATYAVRGEANDVRDEFPPRSFVRNAAPRQSRDEYEAEDEDWRARMSRLSGQEKRDEFMKLCERAWDLFHS
ncbi:Hypothetical protein R9X50_00692000 [Acrodontium crateriforme]|uniref:Uncharacterized protein n=1 Tax=Acrodontium crateriforme TaxID=150365 RepID=A0AAQ3RBV3_9PEZI|nr:Hypothetical protein R9X50_00692000 [Acrodontium crateriforme]